MQLSDAVRQRIINLAYEQNITLHKLSSNAGLSYSTLNSFLNGKSKSPKLVTILHICEGLNIELNEFFSDDLFKNVEDDEEN